VKQGLIHIYCGEGKGKTTAALGLALRAAGHGLRVLILRFLKGQKSGELVSLEKIPEITVFHGRENLDHFSFEMTEEQKKQSRLIHNENLRQAIAEIGSGEFDLVILDEIIPAYNLQLVDQKLLLDFLKNKPAALEVALTGRDPQPELLELADYVSEIKKVKHPYDRGVRARDGIEK